MPLVRTASRLLIVCLLALLAREATAADKASSPPPQERDGLPLLFHEDFESGKADHWQPTDPKAWRVEHDKDGNHLFNQFEKKSKFTPPFRSPFNRALLKDVTVGDFILDVDLKSTVPDYGHRSLCLFFGYQDDAHLYYVHFGKKADDHANQIFIVNEQPRTKISTKSTPGTDWTDGWHHARIVRDVESGKIEVYFDDMDTPVMTAVDKTFTAGRIGIGSFDDTGHFDNITLYGEKAEPAPPRE